MKYTLSKRFRNKKSEAPLRFLIEQTLEVYFVT